MADELYYNLAYHLSPIGTDFVENGEMTRTYEELDEPQKLLAFQVYFSPTTNWNLNIEYMAHIAKVGDVDWEEKGHWIDGEDPSKHLEGFAVRLTGGAASEHTVRYRALLRGKGLTEWFADGKYCGTRSERRPLEAMQVQIFHKSHELKVNLQAMQEIPEWYRNGGEGRAGLPAGTTQDLSQSIETFNREVDKTSSTLYRIISEWGKIGEMQDVQGIQSSIQTILSDLQLASREMDELRNAASKVSVQNTDLIDVIANYIWENEKILQDAEADFSLIDERYIAAKEARKKAKAQLEGATGVSNALLTGITLGIHNPVKKNLDKANESLKIMKAERVNANQLIKDTKKSIGELKEGKLLFRNIGDIVTGITSMQNIALQLDGDIQTANKEAQKILNTGSDRVRSHYLDRASKNMEEMKSWNIQLQQLL